MPLSHVDYEIVRPDAPEVPPVKPGASAPVNLGAVSAAAEALAEATALPASADTETENETPVPSPAPEPPPPAVQKSIAVGQVPAEEQNENDAGPEWPGDADGNFENRIDAARGRINDPSQRSEDWPVLLEQAITLLETIAGHPALTDYSALKQRLDNVEQILNSSGNVR